MKLTSTIRFVFVCILAFGFVGQLVAQTLSLEALGRQGPYQVASFTQLPTVPEFGDATLYFPANKAQGFGGVLISPGFFERQENISWWGNYLASHGFAVIIFDTNELRDLPPLRADALLAAIGLLRDENSRQGSAVRGKILEGSMAVMGHSMGGHGALTIGLKNPRCFTSFSAFSPIVAPTQCPWGQKAFSNYLGSDTSTWDAYDACKLLGQATEHRPILIDQGTADNFLEEQLKTHLIEEASSAANYPIEVRMQEGYDHSYYFIASFIEDHLRFHAAHLHA